MKLRNKKTGDILNIEEQATIDFVKLIETSLPKGFNEWEEVKEPLIKDEKIRKAVRAWAEANGLYEDIEIHTLTAGTRFRIGLGHYGIEFLGYFIYDLESDKTYSITELCGEEEG